MAETKINVNQTNITASDLGAIQNTATGTNSLTILGDPGTGANSINIGTGTTARGADIVIGYDSYGYGSSVVVGYSCSSRGSSSGANVIIGTGSYTGNNTYDSIAIGEQAIVTQSFSIQLGGGTNNESGTFCVGSYYNNNTVNYKLLDANGTIPTDRLINTINKYSTMPTAASTNEGWIVQFTGTTDANYTHGYIYECKAQGTNPETYAWEAVEVQASSGGLPSQTGNAYYFLTTNGTTASWTDQTRGFTYTKASGNNTYSIAQCGLYNDAAFSFTTGGSGFRFFVGSGANFRMGANGFYNDSNYSLGSVTYPWAKAYISKINNGSDITVPNQAGTMVVATPPSADGTYVLKATVSSGTVTYQWVAE